MSNKYHDLVLKVIQEKGAVGVSVIAAEIGMPVTSVQRYLEKQSYFKKNLQRKWDLPSNIFNHEDAANIAHSLETQAIALSNQFNFLNTQFGALVSQIQFAAPMFTRPESYAPPVASKPSVVIDRRWAELVHMAREVSAVFKRKRKETPEAYVNLLKQFDYISMVIQEGQKTVHSFLEEEIYNLLLGQTDTLSDEAVKLLETYQIGQPEMSEE